MKKQYTVRNGNDEVGLNNEEYELFEKLIQERNRIGSSYPDHLIAGDIAFREPARSKQSVEIIILGVIHQHSVENEPWGFMKDEDNEGGES